MNQKGNSTIIGIVAIVLIGLAVAGTIVLKNTKSDDNMISNSTNKTNASDVTRTDSSNSSSSSTGTYKDGTYKATASYDSPGGLEEIDVSVTLKSGKITNSSVSPQAASRESMGYQDEFASNYAKLVNGKDISSLRLSKVAGSSLTSRGFNDAIDKIKQQAKS